MTAARKYADQRAKHPIDALNKRFGVATTEYVLKYTGNVGIKTFMLVEELHTTPIFRFTEDDTKSDTMLLPCTSGE